ncbi:MAG: 16S rRNA processing protein RimM [Microthrixaceae bacterium]|nr:16S rRNA processing protein RimM [Microthrixaceae bacterium]
MSEEPDSSSEPSLLEVGRVTKAHGLGGEVVVFLSTDRVERASVGSVLSSPKGDLTVERSRPHQDRWIVKFKECSGRDEAERLNGTPLFAEPLADDDAFWVHDLIGKTVVTPDGVERGVVDSVIDAPASDILSLDSGALVPVVFIVSSPSDPTIVVDTPDGLFELYES